MGRPALGTFCTRMPPRPMVLFGGNSGGRPDPTRTRPHPAGGQTRPPPPPNVLGRHKVHTNVWGWGCGTRILEYSDLGVHRWVARVSYCNAFPPLSRLCKPLGLFFCGAFPGDMATGGSSVGGCGRGLRALSPRGTPETPLGYPRCGRGFVAQGPRRGPKCGNQDSWKLWPLC